MSLLPGQILPETIALGRSNSDGSVTITHDWWLLFYNLSEQVLSNGSGATTLEIANAALFQAKGPDYEHQISTLAAIVNSLPNPAGRIAALERQVADLQLLVATLGA